MQKADENLPVAAYLTLNTKGNFIIRYLDGIWSDDNYGGFIEAVEGAKTEGFVLMQGDAAEKHMKLANKVHEAYRSCAGLPRADKYSTTRYPIFALFSGEIAKDEDSNSNKEQF